MTALPITRVVLYKHGVGYFERQGAVEGDATLTLTFKQAEGSDRLKSLTVLDPDAGLRRDLDHYLRTQLASKKKDARGFTFFAQGQGKRTVRLSYTLAAPVWKATYRIILGEEGKPPMIQGWAVVDNMQDEDWENVQLSLIAGLPVSFVHDLYTPRYIRRPVVAVQETTGVLPPEIEEGIPTILDQRLASPPPAGIAEVPAALARKARRLAPMS